MTPAISKAHCFQSLPPESSTSLLAEIGTEGSALGHKLVILDDDPTGTQTVYDVPVLTEWSVEALMRELREPEDAFYILTNSRSLTREAAFQLNREIAIHLRMAAERTRRVIEVISRSDSTLRGHFPAEINALMEGLLLSPDGILIIPAFFEAGRYTIHDTHYVADGEHLIPAAETEFARDSYFGYHNSDLRGWLMEKTGRALTHDEVVSISIDDIRQGGIAAVETVLLGATGGQFIIVNAAAYSDLEIFVLALVHAMRAGKRYLARTAASYVRARMALSPRPLLTRADIIRGVENTSRGGLIVAGSYIGKSTRQIEAALALPNVAGVELRAEQLLSDAGRVEAIEGALELISCHLAVNRDTLLYTSRTLITGRTQEETLHIGQRISAALIEVVRRLAVRPCWLIAKGGITSSDIATKALGVRRAWVLGQLLPGISVWKLGHEARWKELPYIIFPGNVGDDQAIAEAIRRLRGEVAE